MDSDFVSADRLMRALSNGEFEPYLQTVVSASDLTVSGAELLVRWHMPAGEIIPPAYFINRMESAGLLLSLAEKILNRAVAGLSEVKAILPRGFRLAVCVFRSIRSRICIEVRSAIRILSINRELNFFYRVLTRFFDAFHYRGIFPQGLSLKDQSV